MCLPRGNCQVISSLKKLKIDYGPEMMGALLLQITKEREYQQLQQEHVEQQQLPH